MPDLMNHNCTHSLPHACRLGRLDIRSHSQPTFCAFRFPLILSIKCKNTQKFTNCCTLLGAATIPMCIHYDKLFRAAIHYIQNGARGTTHNINELHTNTNCCWWPPRFRVGFCHSWHRLIRRLWGNRYRKWIRFLFSFHHQPGSTMGDARYFPICCA